VLNEISKYMGLLGLLMLLGTCGLAIFKGGRAEREGAILYLVLWLAAMLAPKSDNSQNFVYIVLIADAAAALGFLWLAIRYSNLWLAGAMIAQGVSFGAHAYRLEDDLVTPKWMGMNVYLMVMNLMSLLVLYLILGGTIASWRRRVREKRAGKSKSVLTPATA
jgi:amino acid permease